jgi:type II secretory pathway component GspD/PulD (secretin)
MAVVVLFAVSVGAECSITGINVANKADRVVITVQGDSPLSMIPLLSQSGSYLGFQFPTRLATKGRLVGIHSGRIYNVRYSNFKSNPPTTRIVVNTRAHVDYSTQWSQDRKRLDIHVMKLPIASGTKPTANPAVYDTTVQESVFASTPKPSPLLVASTNPVVPVESSVEEPKVRVLGMAEVKVSDPQEPSATESASDSNKTDSNASTGITLKSRPRLLARSVETASPDSRERKVSLNFLGADINDVLKALAVQSGHNIVAGKDVTGNVTVSLNNVTVEEALDYVAKLSGYSYTKGPNAYLVGTSESLRSLSAGDERASSKVEVVALNYVSADDVLSLLKSRYPDVQASIGSRSTKDGKDAKWASNCNLLVLSGSEKQVADAKSLVAQVDEAARELAENTRTEIYRVKYVSPKELLNTLTSIFSDIQISLAPSDGFDLAAPEAVKMSGDVAGGATVTHSKVEKKADELGYVQAIIIRGPTSSVEKALEMAAKLDVKSPQVKIEAKVTSLTEDGAKKLGLTWEWGDLVVIEDSTTRKTTKTSGDVEEVTQILFGNGSFSRQPWSFKAKLEAIIEEGKGKLLASPSLLCLEGKPSVFFVGDEVTYIQRIETTPTGQNILTDTKQVGVQLRVNADVNPDGYITMNLHPEVSVLKLTVEQGVALPVVTRRFTDHVVRVKDGDTIVIGGLIQDDELEAMSKVPLLGDLPFLGQIFRHKSKTRAHSEVVMFITASLIKD